MTDKLDELFAIQRQFAEMVNAGYDFEELIQNYSVHIAAEAFEVLSQTNWKRHKPKDLVVSKHNVLEEVVDVTKLAFGLLIGLSITPEEFAAAFAMKSEVVQQKYRQEHLQPQENCIAVDLDGVLADHDAALVKFANDILYNRGKFFGDVVEMKRLLGGPEYQRLKWAFRESGAKRTIPAFPGAAEFVRSLQTKGYYVVILSARPYTKHLRIFSDTMEWFARNKIYYDAILFDEHKHLKIVEKMPRLCCMIEDDYYVAEEIASLGYVVYLKNDRRRPPTSVESPMIRRWSSLETLAEQIPSAEKSE